MKYIEQICNCTKAIIQNVVHDNSGILNIKSQLLLSCINRQISKQTNRLLIDFVHSKIKNNNDYNTSKQIKMIKISKNTINKASLTC